MAKEENVPQLEMCWPEKRPFSPPPAPLPAGYRLRTYQPGDEAPYYALMELVGWPGWDDDTLHQWLFRLVPNGWFFVEETETKQLVASAMALHDHTWHTPFCGELGWVSTHPDHRGKGLATAVVTGVINRLLAIGYPTIHLYTEHYRLAALHIYLRLGFEPCNMSDETRLLWQTVNNQLQTR